jgi:hypothetical protein
MFSVRIILSSVFIFVAAFSAQAQRTDAKVWTIADYLKNLPEKYKTFSGDFLPPSKDSTIIDEQKGYAAYFDSPQPGTRSFAQRSPIFEMALFKSEIKPPLVVVANLKGDAVCDDYETFFLRRVGNVWKRVEREVLAPLNLKMFWDKPQSAEQFLKIVERDNATSYRFEPPRQGTQMKVSLEICDYFLEVTPLKSVDELRKLIATTKPIYLNWDSRSGKFNFADRKQIK